MAHTTKCPNCKAPIHLRPDQPTAVCEYCHHQVKQTMMAQPAPRPRPQPRPLQPQVPAVSKGAKRGVLIAVLISMGFPLLLGVGIPLIICNTQRSARVKRVQRQLGVTSLDSDADQKLAMAIGANVKCLNTFVDAVSYMQNRYLGWVDRDAGPDCRSRCVSYGIMKAYYSVDACRKALQQAAGAMPVLQRHGQALLSAASTLKSLSTRAHKYYNQKDYLDDDCAQAKTFHRPLLHAFDAFDKAERAIRDVVDRQLPPLIKRRQANARKRNDAMGQMMASYLQVGIEARALVDACDGMIGSRRTDGDIEAAKALISKIDQTSEATVAAERRVNPRQNNWIRYFLFPYTYESHLESYVGRLTKAAKSHVRCVSGQQRCRGFARTLNPIVEAYNGLVGYAKGFGPKLRKLDDTKYEHCHRRRRR